MIPRRNIRTFLYMKLIYLRCDYTPKRSDFQHIQSKTVVIPSKLS